MAVVASVIHDQQKLLQLAMRMAMIVGVAVVVVRVAAVVVDCGRRRHSCLLAVVEAHFRQR